VRDQYLRDAGWRVLRFWNTDILQTLKALLTPWRPRVGTASQIHQMNPSPVAQQWGGQGGGETMQRLPAWELLHRPCPHLPSPCFARGRDLWRERTQLKESISLARVMVALGEAAGVVGREHDVDAVVDVEPLGMGVELFGGERDPAT